MVAIATRTSSITSAMSLARCRIRRTATPKCVFDPLAECPLIQGFVIERLHHLDMPQRFTRIAAHFGQGILT